VYTFDPLPKIHSQMEEKHIIGGQANLWRERVPDDKSVEFVFYFILFLFFHSLMMQEIK
jgi:N-acetyl-beta-hexosaminidase